MSLIFYYICLSRSVRNRFTNNKMRLWHFSSSVNSFFKCACAAIQWGLDVWCLVGPFVYFHTSCVRTAKALARLRSLAWAFAGRLCDKYHNLMSWLNRRCPILNQHSDCQGEPWHFAQFIYFETVLAIYSSSKKWNAVLIKKKKKKKKKTTTKNKTKKKKTNKQTKKKKNPTTKTRTD